MSIIIQQNCQTDCSDIDISVNRQYNIKDLNNIKDLLLDANEQFHIVAPEDESKSVITLFGFIESIRQFVVADSGQFIQIDANDLIGSTLSKRLHSIMTEVLANRPYRIQLPIILQHNPHTASPFIDRAIAWQRLCDLILEDDMPQRPTALVIENIEIADHNIQHELARLIRMHKNNRINRIFFVTINNNAYLEQLLPELRELAQITTVKSIV
ncbi:MAG: hypothetical protein LBB88_06170 [Planctomycetaceae bacterium]|jgi:hypothetical protein|nr:hypothetical protein [Planctomycetaceae bacterium]